ncbi:MAG: Crp/Fnr family transcriptional regulator [Pseudomonadota bacterium]
MSASMPHKLIDNNWLNSLPESARKELIGSSRVKQFESGQVVLHKGDPPGSLFGVISGRVRVCAATFSGEELVFTSVLPGEWFGEISLLDGEPRTHDSYAVEDSELAVIPNHAISKLIKTEPAVYTALVRLLCSHCRQAFAAIDDFLLFTPAQRLAKTLLGLANNAESNSLVKLSQAELGGLIGVSRQTANKILSDWETRGLIKRRYGAIEIRSGEALSTLLDIDP